MSKRMEITKREGGLRKLLTGGDVVDDDFVHMGFSGFADMGEGAGGCTC